MKDLIKIYVKKKLTLRNFVLIFCFRLITSKVSYI